MHLGKYVEEDINIEEIVKDLQFNTKWGAEAALKIIRAPTEDIGILQKKQQTLLSLRKWFRKQIDKKEQVKELLTRANTLELDESAKSDDRVDEYYSQMLWEKKSLAAPLNENTLWMEISAIWKVWIIPMITILIPFLMIAIPFIFLRVFMRVPINFQNYWKQLQQVLQTQGGHTSMLTGMLVPPWLAGGEKSRSASSWMQWGTSLFMFGSSAWQQVTTSRHLHTITADMRKRGNSIIQLQEIHSKLNSLLPEKIFREIVSFPTNNTLRAFGVAWNTPELLYELKSSIGQIDVNFTLATTKGIGFPQYIRDNKNTVLDLDNFYHPHLISKNPVRNSIIINSKNNTNHVLLSGPNRGGKSTMLKAVLANILLAQTFGLCFARRMRITPFVEIHTALSPSDTLGRLSLFEAEIDFAKEMLDRLRASKGPNLLLMDEIFHSTNALDGIEASRVFLDQLYTMSNKPVTLISTHYTNLPEEYAGKKCASPYCLHASLDKKTDNIKYSYKLIKGINDISSVREILRERGLLIPEPAAARSN